MNGEIRSENPKKVILNHSSEQYFSRLTFSSKGKIFSKLLSVLTEILRFIFHLYKCKTRSTSNDAPSHQARSLEFTQLCYVMFDVSIHVSNTFSTADRNFSSHQQRHTMLWPSLGRRILWCTESILVLSPWSACVFSRV